MATHGVMLEFLAEGQTYAGAVQRVLRMAETVHNEPIEQGLVDEHEAREVYMTFDVVRLLGVQLGLEDV